MRFHLSAILLLFSCVASSVWADPLSRDSLRISPENGRALEPGGVTQSVQAQVDGRRVPQFEWPEAGYGEPEVEAGTDADKARKGGRLSAEERRALRRQINEAGLDLYLPKR